MSWADLWRDLLSDEADVKGVALKGEPPSNSFTRCASGMAARMGEDPPAGLPRSRQSGPEGETPNPVVASEALRKPSRSRSNERL